MAITLPVLDAITIPTNCPVPWESMSGVDRSRHCTRCDERVHDVSSLTSVEAAALLSGRTMQPCLRIYRRRDGRVMTADCPANRRERAWRWLRRRSAWAAAWFAFALLPGCKTIMGGPMASEYLEATRIFPGPLPNPADQPTPPTPTR